MKEYTFLIGGIAHTMLLDDEDAKARGLVPDAEKAKAGEATGTKSRTPANKARTPAANKS